MNRDQVCVCMFEAWPFARISHCRLYHPIIVFMHLFYMYVQPIESSKKCRERFSNLFELMCVDFNLTNLNSFSFLFHLYKMTSHKNDFTFTVFRIGYPSCVFFCFFFILLNKIYNKCDVLSSCRNTHAHAQIRAYRHTEAMFVRNHLKSAALRLNCCGLIYKINKHQLLPNAHCVT